jgi:hypothetical protein
MRYQECSKMAFPAALPVVWPVFSRIVIGNAVCD